MKRLKIANHLFQHISWFLILAVLAFSVWNDGGIDILSHLLVSASLFILAACYYLRNSGILVHKRKIKIGGEVLFLILFILFFFISFVLSQTKNVGLFELILFVSSVFLYIFISSQKWKTGIFEKFLILTLLIGVFASLYGYYDYISEPFNRLASTFGISIYKFVSYPNAFANFLIALVPIPFYFLHKKIPKNIKVLLVISIVIILTALFLTYSRGAYLTLVAMAILHIVILAISKAKPKELIKKFVLIFLLVLVSIILTIPINQIRKLNHQDVISFTEKVSFESDEQTVSATNRMDFWKGSALIFADNPYFGTGPGSFEYVFPAYQESFLGNSNSPHNFFLKILSENGIFAAVFIIMFLIWLFYSTLRNYKDITKAEKALLFVLFISVSGNLLHNMIDYNLNFVSTILLLFAFLGMIGSVKNKYSGFKMPEIWGRVTKAILLSVSVIMLFISFHEAYYSYVFKKARALHKQGSYQEAVFLYEKAENIYLKRGYYIVYAQMYHEKYDEEGGFENLEKAESLLLSGLKLNMRDAFLLNYLGDIYYEMNNYDSAVKFYQKALEADPKNNLDYYYDILKTDKDLSIDEIDFIIDLLEEYEYKLSQNAHLTVLTGNPKSALKMYAYLLERLQNTGYYMQYRNLIVKRKDEMQTTYLNEKEKFENHYDLELTEDE